MGAEGGGSGVGVRITVLGPGDVPVLSRVADGVFDGPVRTDLVQTFLSDPRHHLVVALDGDVVVGMASGVHYVHPDKDPELWINEVGVAPGYHRRGIGRRLIEGLLRRGRDLGCREAWVLAEGGNGPARRLYETAGGVPSPDPVVRYSFPLPAAGPGDR